MPEHTVLAFDFGLARIGLAVGVISGQRAQGLARALCTIAAQPATACWTAIAAVVSEWQPDRLLVGRPQRDDGSAHPLAAACDQFAASLAQRFALPVERVDERFSSLEADARLRAQGGKQRHWQARKKRLDAEAASVILNDWFLAAPVSTERGGTLAPS